MTLDPTAHVLLAILALDDGDPDAALAHISSAQGGSRTTARRHRQVVEIASLIVSGAAERAAGLAVMHAAEFPDDADLLARVTSTTRDAPRGATWTGP